jgi:hypothetical protein
MTKKFYITTTNYTTLDEWKEILYAYDYYVFLFEYKLSGTDVKYYLSPLTGEDNGIKGVIEICSDKKNFVLKDGMLEKLINSNTPYNYVIMEEIHD